MASSNRLPMSSTMFFVDFPKTPVVSTAIGSNKYRAAISLYRLRLRSSVANAADPAVVADLLRLHSAYVSVQVQSQTRLLPFLYGKTVTPSGLLASSIKIPEAQ